jgi:hypothetical protein
MIREPPLVSILIPAYHERFFAEALASALSQTYPLLEVVVCDDSPGAAIAATVQRAADSRIRYVRNPARLGFAGNFTQCFELARGEYLKFLNDDDRLHPQCVEALAGILRSNSAVTLATSRRNVIDGSGQRLPDIGPTAPLSHVSAFMPGVELGNFVLMSSLNFIGEPSTVLFRKADLKVEGARLFQWGAHDYHCLADMSLWLRLLAGGLGFYHSNTLSDFRIHEGQEQDRDEMPLTCILERYWIAQQARKVGFLQVPLQWLLTLRAVRARAAACDLTRVDGTTAAKVVEFLRTIDDEIARAEPAAPRA